jgi:hypothetical protein
MFGIFLICFVFIKLHHHSSFSNKIKQTKYDSSLSIQDLNNTNNNNNFTNYKIEKFIENLKLQTFDLDEIEIWDNGEIEWEL